MTGLAARPYRQSGPRWPSRPPLFRPTLLLIALACSMATAQPVKPAPAVPAAVTAAAPAAVAPIQNSAMDSLLFYQMLIGELELNAGRAGNAYGVVLDAARRNGDEALYQRAVEIALQARAGEQALEAASAWRAAKPTSLAPLRYQSQILLALNRIEDAANPMAYWLAAVPLMERPGLLASLPRMLQNQTDRQRVLALVEKLVLPYLDSPGTATPSRVSLGRAHLAANNLPQALGLAKAAQAADGAAPGPVMLALEMLPATAAAEPVVTDYLARPDAEPALRLAYVRMLAQSQRYADATRQLERLTLERPTLPEPWLTLGALRADLKQPREAEAALLKFVELASAPGVQADKPSPAAAAAGDDEDETADATEGGTAAGRDLTQAWLLLAQVAEQCGDARAAEAYLAKVDSPQRALEVQARRASLLARQGKVKEARLLIQAVPERTGDDARAKLVAEAQVLRDVKRWQEAGDVLAAASQRFTDDVDLLYEQAMVEEKLERWDSMERLLRRVIELKPEHPHAHNALGYSLADRGVRLPEARDLVTRALQLAPGDPFITDSLGWIEFRMGNRDEALRLLRQAHAARPDTEIGAHLGEVLWALGRRDEARAVWQDARGRDAANEVLRETLARLKVDL